MFKFFKAVYNLFMIGVVIALIQGFLNGSTNFNLSGDQGPGFYTVDTSYYDQFDYHDKKFGVGNLQLIDLTGYGTYGIVGSFVAHDLPNVKDFYDYVQIEIPLETKNGRHLGIALANTNNITKGTQWDFEALILDFNIDPDDLIVRTENIKITTF